MTSKGATIDVGAWLRGLGLGEYEATFRENAINEKVLPNLTSEDLKDMDIGIVGHHRKVVCCFLEQCSRRLHAAWRFSAWTIARQFSHDLAIS